MAAFNIRETLEKFPNHDGIGQKILPFDHVA